ncbi:nuclear transport factor 2 family protein [Sphingomonas sp. CLY1604]|uniref:nuclear transport factor 2 family protein n=1 Tax=Sphingomonas sp. CLY1604 TaxID=3457786 RepID=UPI003FD7E4CB
MMPAVSLPLLLALQSADTLPPANPLPYADPDAVAVMAPVNALLAALERNDGAAVLAATLPEGTVTVARTAPDGTPQRRTQRWADFAATLRPDAARASERLGEPAIEVDGDVAMVWASYTVTVDGKPSHCGYNLFDLVRGPAGAGGWRILNVTYSHRTTGCPA